MGSNIDILTKIWYTNFMSTQEMIKEALNLSPKEKSQIIEALLLSLDQPDSIIENIWNSEIDRRIDAIEDGSTETIPYKKVF
jgi:putative addiction module component (TIGR02574 family)